MTAIMNPTVLFQQYVQNAFKFPKEIKDDIVYCQRALKAHIKVHQMVLDVYRAQQNANPTEKQRIIDELETQIYEINAEQQFLLLRLRGRITEFHKSLDRKGIPVIPELLNETISNELVPLINNPDYLVYPSNVRLRCTEEKLIEKYFEVKDSEAPSNCIEILDSDEEEQAEQETLKPKLQKLQSKSAERSNSNDGHENRGISLLKPVAERTLQTKRSSLPSRPNNNVPRFLELGKDVVKENADSILTPNITISTIKRRSEPSNVPVYPVSISVSKNIAERERDDSLVPQNIKRSRLNLREVLKNAQNGNQATKVVATNISKPALAKTSPPKKEEVPAKKAEKNNRSPPRTADKAGTTSSSSGSSTPERSLTPPQVNSQCPAENVDTRVKPDDYDQENFLRLFGLFTPEMRLQMQQRRSKRRRRTVQSNERSDYHYGHIEYGSCTSAGEKKKRKAFLLSPQVKRKIGRPPKRRSVEKSDEPTSRSGSSSPAERNCCNECLKDEGILECCEACKNHFHHACHAVAEKSNKNKMCPSCIHLLKSETQSQQYHYTTLQASANKLKQKLSVEKTRHKSLQHKSEAFKTEMSMLFDIIRAIKKDPQCEFEE